MNDVDERQRPGAVRPDGDELAVRTECRGRYIAAADVANVVQSLPAGHIPDLQSAGIGPGGEDAAVGAEGDARDVAAEAAQQCQALAAARVPQRNVVPMSGRDDLAARGDGEGARVSRAE